jgi:hypothetical protein
MNSKSYRRWFFLILKSKLIKRGVLHPFFVLEIYQTLNPCQKRLAFCALRIWRSNQKTK